MARNAEKAMTALARWRRMKEEEERVKREEEEREREAVQGERGVL